jgi:hypothetical protein
MGFQMTLNGIPLSGWKSGAPEKIRTRNPQIRSLVAIVDFIRDRLKTITDRWLFRGFLLLTCPNGCGAGNEPAAIPDGNFLERGQCKPDSDRQGRRARACDPLLPSTMPSMRRLDRAQQVMESGRRGCRRSNEAGRS